MTALDIRFKVVALGDSVMWGQGLFEHQKIHNLVAAELAQRGLIVHTILHAHSGAIIGEPDVPTNKPPIDGEVPVSEPTVFEQIEAVLDGKERDEAVNLVMISGGVNDVDITRILNLSDRGLDQHIEDSFYRKMKLLIERTYHCFPNAIIMICGYYLFVSDDSEQTITLNALKALGFSVPLLPHTLAELVLEWLGDTLTGTLIERCAHFRDTAHRNIREVIVELVDIMPEARERVFFADPKFKEDNALGASNSFLYGIDPDLSPQDPDEIAVRRAKACELHADRLTMLERVAGPRASVGHPNPLGARHYADAIIADLRYAMPTVFAAE